MLNVAMMAVLGVLVVVIRPSATESSERRRLVGLVLRIHMRWRHRSSFRRG